MDIHYPAGVKPPVLNSSTGAIKKTGKKKPALKVAPGNRGMDFEAAINETNLYYSEKGLCLITKRPTPVNIVKVDYTHGAKITQAFFETQSTTDYNGVYQGHYIDFEAKSTRSKTSFPLANIPIQQIRHLKGVISQNGIAFFLICFALLGEVYLLPASFIIDFYEKRPRASIPLSEIRLHGRIVEEGFRPRYDYLPVFIDVFLK